MNTHVDAGSETNGYGAHALIQQLLCGYFFTYFEKYFITYLDATM